MLASFQGMVFVLEMNPLPTFQNLIFKKPKCLESLSYSHPSWDKACKSPRHLFSELLHPASNLAFWITFNRLHVVAPEWMCLNYTDALLF